MNNNDKRADEQPHKILCAWCGATMRPGREPVSHSICAACAGGARREAGLDARVRKSSPDREEIAALMSEALMREVGRPKDIPSHKQLNHMARYGRRTGGLGRVLLHVGSVGDHGVEACGGEWREAVMRAGRAIDRERRQSAEERWRAYRRREAWEVAGTVAFGVGLGVVAWLMMVW